MLFQRAIRKIRTIRVAQYLTEITAFKAKLLKWMGIKKKVQCCGGMCCTPRIYWGFVALSYRCPESGRVIRDARRNTVLLLLPRWRKFGLYSEAAP
jgi:hypothetical protein